MPELGTAHVKANSRHALHLHPLPVRIMHWINAIAIFIMIGSGWKIYNDDILFSFLRFPDAIVIGKWAQYGLQWHFFGMWIFVLNGLAYLCYGIATGRFRRKLFPISVREVFTTIGEALRFRLRHDDLIGFAVETAIGADAELVPRSDDASNLQPGGDGAIRSDAAPGPVRRRIHRLFQDDAGVFCGHGRPGEQNRRTHCCGCENAFFHGSPLALRVP